MKRQTALSFIINWEDSKWKLCAPDKWQISATPFLQNYSIFYIICFLFCLPTLCVVKAFAQRTWEDSCTTLLMEADFFTFRKLPFSSQQEKNRVTCHWTLSYLILCSYLKSVCQCCNWWIILWFYFLSQFWKHEWCGYFVLSPCHQPQGWGLRKVSSESIERSRSLPRGSWFGMWRFANCMSSESYDLTTYFECNDAICFDFGSLCNLVSNSFLVSFYF